VVVREGGLDSNVEDIKKTWFLISVRGRKLGGSGQGGGSRSWSRVKCGFASLVLLQTRGKGAIRRDTNVFQARMGEGIFDGGGLHSRLTM